MNTRAARAEPSLEPERIGDVEEGAGAPESQVDDMGLTPSERAAWDQMEADTSGDAAAEPTEPAPEAEGEAAAGGDGAQSDQTQPAPQALQKPEQTPVEDDEDDEPVVQGKKPGQTVSRHKYTRELNKRDTELATLRQQVTDSGISQAKLTERLNILNEALTAPAPVDPQVARQQAIEQNPWLEDTINPMDDAVAALAQMQRRQSFNHSQGQAQQEYLTASAEDRDLHSAFERDVANFSQSEGGAGFRQAYEYIKQSRLTEIAVSLYDKDPNDPNEQFTQKEIDKIIEDFNAEERWVVQNALSQRKSPSAALMKLAKGRGWKYEAPQAAPAPAARQPAKGIPAQRQAPAPTAAAKIASEIEGAAASRSLSDGGGAPPQEPLSLERLLKMKDDEFGDFIDNIPEHRLQALLGRPDDM